MTEDAKPKWTQGPWKVDFSDYPFCIVKGKKVICSAIEENDANLIAAAPDLYHALYSVMLEFGPGTMSEEAFEAACVALAKARRE